MNRARTVIRDRRGGFMKKVYLILLSVFMALGTFVPVAAEPVKWVSEIISVPD